MRSYRQLIGNDGGRIERVGVILPQCKAIWQGTARRKCLQRQRKIPSLVRGCADELAHISQIKQPHLHSSRRPPGRQAHPTFKERGCSDVKAQHQPDETADKQLHKVNSLYKTRSEGHRARTKVDHQNATEKRQHPRQSANKRAFRCLASVDQGPCQVLRNRRRRWIQ